eukprot:CAMPEP_0202977022 /NCGR_PEP_ID=MMETSP1396-20130829/82658_1 /ASSEMBLY_ACC=CAM_ASM_000872 /TAXON_ID= /ORGANISM="Pseudokeronopsis sp., Strain Brazil" /LENGTH=66 /DNA_ID=CAMNT_0049715433 /DNA_START=331 /DNA_END=527 /DNA_ORIENTATION=-
MRSKGLQEDEIEFTDVVQTNITNKKEEWQDRYEPRKPRFYNTVQTGYEWNKYNQTHYDLDNPPPKV